MTSPLLTRPQLSTGRRVGLTVLRGYLVIAAGMSWSLAVVLALWPRPSVLLFASC